ncbi:membrane protein insertase YidC [Luteimonas aquatica]|uniref:membrane protein insertase YidC n=1 Tax=Luteimonas aquatica TaxID=450364 RepID=UPI001F58C676|nr:membrane protein insertase YidC [Luteimonas aquatica]
MNPTRTVLIFAWLMVAVLLWMEWGKERNAPPPPTAQAASGAAIPSLVPGEVASTVPSATPAVPTAAPTAAATPVAQPSAAAGPRVTITTDVLRLRLDGGNIFDAELLQYPQSRDAGSPPVKLFDETPAHYYVAQSGWIGQNGATAPSHVSGFVPEQAGNADIKLGTGQSELSVPFVWKSADGVTIRRVWTVKRGSYVIGVRDEAVNGGAKPWQGYIYRQLARIPPEAKSGMTNPESYSFAGAKWYNTQGDYDGRRYKDFVDDGPLDITVTGGWIALLQHHFFTAWIPQHDQDSRFSLVREGSVDSIRSTGPGFALKPGEKGESQARLWVGPKLVSQINAQGVPGLNRAVDYSRFTIFATLGQGLFWVLDKLHGLFGNWGWTIIGMVLLLKLLLFPLSAAQYKSAAKMRKFQPRMAQLKERYGDDKQKFQLALMELYKKEKINPVGGCLPIIPQMIIFMALYWVLMESVELRQAPWALWIKDLTARDPYFILPIVNMAIMWTTQRLTPAPGMDPMQQKMMQTMPLVFGVILAFLPAGLVLYQVANGGLGLLQQWYMLRKYADKPAGEKAAAKS